MPKSESKRRMRNLMDRSGLLAQLTQRDAEPASLEEIRRIHADPYLTEFRTLSDARGGMLGISAPFGHGSYEIACQSAGLAREALLSVLRGEHDTAYALTRPRGILLADGAMGFCLLANIPLLLPRPVPPASFAFSGHRLHVHPATARSRSSLNPDVHTLSIHQPICFRQAMAGLRIAALALAPARTPICHCRRLRA